MSGDLRYEKELLMRSLMQHEFDKHTMEVNFSSGLRLNIADPFRGVEMPPVEIPKLFSATAPPECLCGFSDS